MRFQARIPTGQGPKSLAVTGGATVQIQAPPNGYILIYKILVTISNSAGGALQIGSQSVITIPGSGVNFLFDWAHIVSNVIDGTKGPIYVGPNLTATLTDITPTGGDTRQFIYEIFE